MYSPLNLQLPGTLAGLVVMSLGMQVTPRSIPCLAHSFGHENISNLAASFLSYNEKASVYITVIYSLITKMSIHGILVCKQSQMKHAQL